MADDYINYMTLDSLEVKTRLVEERTSVENSGFYPHDLEPSEPFKLNITEWRLELVERGLMNEPPYPRGADLRAAAIDNIRALDFKSHENIKRRHEKNIALAKIYPRLVPEIVSQRAGLVGSDPHGAHRPIDIIVKGDHVVACLDCDWYSARGSHFELGCQHRALHMRPPAAALCTSLAHPQHFDAFKLHLPSELKVLEYPPPAVKWTQIRVSGHGMYDFLLCSSCSERFDEEHPG